MAGLRELICGLRIWRNDVRWWCGGCRDGGPCDASRKRVIAGVSGFGRASRKLRGVCLGLGVRAEMDVSEHAS